MVDRLDRGGSRSQLSGGHKEELLETLTITLREALDLNRREAREAAGASFEEAVIAL
jgi:hypothetical protein